MFNLNIGEAQYQEPLILKLHTRPLSHCVPQILNGQKHPGLQIFFKIGGPKWPMKQKIMGHFMKWWAQAYQTKHSWHLGSILYLHTDTDTCMHICMLTADYTVKPVLSCHSNKKTNYRLMQVKSIADLQSFRPSLSYHLLLRSLFFSFLVWVGMTIFIKVRFFHN